MPLVIYMVALSGWILVACAIWCAAGLMCVVQRTRSRGRCRWRLSQTFAYQIFGCACCPHIAASVGSCLRYVDPASPGGDKNPAVIAGFICTVLLSCLLRPLRASLTVGGRVEGSRAAARLGRCYRVQP
jgi:hypothetical protein